MAVRRLILAAALGTVGALAGCDKLGLGAGSGDGSGSSGSGSFRSIDITGADYANELGLPDADGNVRTLAEFKGKVIVVFFGFTQCPDVCPTTLVELATIREKLGPDGARLQGIFVTVDPERDTPEVLKAYVGNFGADFVALRGTPEQTAALAKRFKVFFAKVPGKTADGYTIDHTAGSYVFDAKGRVRLFTRYGMGAEALTADLKKLLAEG
jgi:protein SCO1/2